MYNCKSLFSEATKQYLIKQCDDIFEWTSYWIENIPYLNFEPDWQVKSLPPYNGAITNIHIKKGDNLIKLALYSCSVKAIVQGPYWVLDFNGNIEHFDVNFTNTMMQHIKQLLA